MNIARVGRSKWFELTERMVRVGTSEWSEATVEAARILSDVFLATVTD